MTNVAGDGLPAVSLRVDLERFSLPFKALSGKIAVPFRGSPPGDSFYGTESVELKANKLDRPGVFTLVYP